MKCTCGSPRLLLKLHLSKNVFVIICATCITLALHEERWGKFKKIESGKLIPNVLETLVDFYAEEVEGTWGLDAPRIHNTEGVRA